MTFTFKQMRDLYDEFVSPEVEPIDKQYVFRCSTHGAVVDPLIIDDIYITCPSCGECEMRPCYTPSPVFNMESNHYYFPKNTGAYKRVAYFDTLIAKLCGHNYIHMDRYTKKKIQEQIPDIKDFNIPALKSILKYLELTKYYKCCYSLMDALGGNKENKATVSPNECDALKYLFRQLQTPYEKYKVTNRCNFMSYSFVLQKLFHQIGRTDLCHLLPLPKNIFIVYQNELIWASICDDLEWDNDYVLFETHL